MKKMYEEGGLATDGLEIDPVSGNDIPVGSNAADVRDDVDAKLSEGEYVVPADVVKYIGVSTLEKMVNKAKEGLGDMEENGRIGGAPIASAEAKEEILEHSLGGDIEELDGYAAGGVVEGKDYNAIIDRVKAAAMKDPSITNMLKAKGIHISGAEQGAPVKMAEGGVVPGQTSSFDPYAYTPGFSIESGATGQAPASGTAPVQPVTCPPGYVLDTATNSCVVDPNYQAPVQQASGGGGGGDSSPAPTTDPNAWMNKYDYTNPETLTKQTMSTLDMGEGEEKGVFGKIAEGVGSLLGGGLAGGLLGKVFNSQKYAEAMANAAVLESHGKKAEAASIREAAGLFAKENEVKVGGFFDSTKTLTNNAMKTYGRNTMIGDTPTSTQRPSATAPKKPSAADYKGGAGEVSAPVRSTAQVRQDRDNSSNRAQDVARAKSSAIQKASAGSGKSIAEVGRTVAPSTKAPSASDKAAKKAGATRGAGGQFGMAKGGLVSRPTDKAPKADKPNTTTKGLGRK